MPADAEDLLREGLQELHLQASEKQIRSLVQYLQLLQKWNKHFNLTGVDYLTDMVRLHLLDSLTLSPYIKGARVLDVGTGAGLPGIPLAVLFPKTSFILLDSNERKTHFLKQVKIALDLDNVSIVNCRVEDFVPDEPLDIVLCRAFASLPEMLNKTGHLLVSGCKLLAMKGQYPESELAGIGDTFKVDAVEELQVPGLSSERHLVQVSRS